MKLQIVTLCLTVVFGMYCSVHAEEKIENYNELISASIDGVSETIMSNDFDMDTNRVEEVSFGYSYAVPEKWVYEKSGMYRMEDEGGATAVFTINAAGENFESIDDLKKAISSIEKSLTESAFDEVHIQNEKDIVVGNEDGVMFDYVGVTKGIPVFGKLYFVMCSGEMVPGVGKSEIMCMSLMTYDCKYNHNNDCDSVVFSLRKPGGYNADYSFDGTDFLATMPEDEYNQYILTGQWDVLFQKAETYLNEHNDQSEKSSANLIINALRPLMEEWSNVVIKYDDFENDFQAFYSGVEDFSNSIHIVPFYDSGRKVESTKSFILLKCGFYATDWLFFDGIKINSENQVYMSELGKKEEEVVNGGIYEKSTYILDDEKLEKIGDLRGLKIRFINNDYLDRYIDFDITDQEATAVETISRFMGVMATLQDVGNGYYRSA